MGPLLVISGKEKTMNVFCKHVDIRKKKKKKKSYKVIYNLLNSILFCLYDKRFIKISKRKMSQALLLYESSYDFRTMVSVWKTEGIFLFSGFFFLHTGMNYN